MMEIQHQSVQGEPKATPTRFAEHLTQTQRKTLRKVVVKRDFRSLVGHGAKAGAVGYVVGITCGASAGFNPDSKRDVLFTRASMANVTPDCVGQCMCSIPEACLADH